MASSATTATSTRIWRLQFSAPGNDAAGLRTDVRDRLEHWLEAERDQLVLWLPVMLGAGIATWFAQPDRIVWEAALLIAAGVAFAAISLGRSGRVSRVIAVAALAYMLGMVLIWTRAERAGHALLLRPRVVRLVGRVERVEPLVARGLVRLRLATISAGMLGSRPASSATAECGVAAGALCFGPGASVAATPSAAVRRPSAFPEHVRVNIADAAAPPGLVDGAVLAVSARLMPPPGPAIPGAYDFAEGAWFDRIGATGRAFGPVVVISPGPSHQAGLRQRLSRHVQLSAGGAAGGIAAALVTGDQGAIPAADADAMRRSGLAHLLSVSGLHITAVVGAVMLIVLRLLSLSPWAVLRLRLPLIAAGAGALAAIGYTLLTGAEVPTIRSCVASLLVLTALMIGREALTLRLVAAGAVAVLLMFPDSLAGPSFQLSFAAVAAIVAFNEHPRVRAWAAPREEPRRASIARHLGSLLLTGLLVEAALLPITFYHFHRAGIYGAAANIVAIPLTTFVTMPAEALALLLDAVGAGGPCWWLTARSLDLLLWIAHAAAELPGSRLSLPVISGSSYGLMVTGGLWITLWRTRWRRLGIVPLAAGAALAVLTPVPDLLVSGDGRHLALRTATGALALLRDRTGSYVADMFAQNGDSDALPLHLEDQAGARCNQDLCVVDANFGDSRLRAKRTWRVVATRSANLLPEDALDAVCRSADVVVSERRLPPGCRPRWLRLDRQTLAQTGGVAISFASATIERVRSPQDDHPWRASGDSGR